MYTRKYCPMKLSLKLKASSILALTFLIVYMLRPVAAQAPANTTTPATQTPALQQNFAPGTPATISTVSQGAMIGLLSSATCILAGIDPLQPEGKCIGVDPKSGALGYVEGNGGVAGTMGRLIGSTMNIPISSGQYGQYMAANFGGVNHAYAQTNGLGFDRLSPLIGVWARFRDIAYLIFVLAFTIIGFAIILRVKIDARTVMSIQNQIPKIIIALVLVTFSYAIAGFLIDLMYVCMYVIILTFTNITPTSFNPDANVFGVVNKAFNPGFPVIPNAIPDVGPIDGNNFLPLEGVAGQIYNSGIMGIAGKISWTLAGVFTSLATDFIDSTVGSLMQGLFSPFGVLDLGCNALSFIGGYIPSIPVLSGIPVVGGLFGGDPSCNYAETFFRYTIQAIFSALIFIVVMVAIIFNLFRVWFTLIKSFMYVLVDTMIAPLWIAAGIFPGSKLGFIPWVRHLSGHLSVFPTAFGVILLGKTMMDGIATGGTFFSPPLVGDAFGGNSAVAAFVGFGFILSIPTILDRVRTAVGAYSFGLKDIQAGFGAGQGVGKTAGNVAFGQYGHYTRGANGQPEYQPLGGWKKIMKATTGIG